MPHRTYDYHLCLHLVNGASLHASQILIGAPERTTWYCFIKRVTEPAQNMGLYGFRGLFLFKFCRKKQAQLSRFFIAVYVDSPDSQVVHLQVTLNCLPLSHCLPHATVWRFPSTFHIWPRWRQKNIHSLAESYRDPIVSAMTSTASAWYFVNASLMSLCKKLRRIIPFIQV